MTPETQPLVRLRGLDGEFRPLLHLSDAWFDVSESGANCAFRVACVSQADIPKTFTAIFAGSRVTFRFLMEARGKHIFEALESELDLVSADAEPAALMLLTGPGIQ